MGRGKKEKTAIVHFTGIAHKGQVVGRTDEGLVIFAKGAVPGDTVEVVLGKKRKGVMQARVKQIMEQSSFRQAPFCSHFGICGGCSWQELQYNEQLRQKERLVHDAITRIAKSQESVFEPIEAGSKLQYYRNKLEFTFSTHRWLTKGELDENQIIDKRALGFHRPESFDKVVDIKTCYLQNDISNAIRNDVRKIAMENDFSFYDVRKHEGYLRNLIVRSNEAGEIMCILATGEDHEEKLKIIVDFITGKYPDVKSFYHVLNTKKNDSMFDLSFNLVYGEQYLKETLDHAHFLIGPKSFFQTNTSQTCRLYQIVDEYAAIQSHETVYDMYCGVGSIGIYLARKAKLMIGIEEIEAAIEDAWKNAEYNNLTNAHFYAGDVRHVFNDELIHNHGQPDVIIVDPPRAGLHEEVIQHILKIEPGRIIYVSCNPATQARDVSLFAEKYKLEKIRPVDMFPYTNHVESVGLLVKKS